MVAALEILDERTAASKTALVRAKRELSEELASIGWLQQATPELVPHKAELQAPTSSRSSEELGCSAVLGVRAGVNPTAKHRLDSLAVRDTAREDEEVRHQIQNLNLS